ncbi:MAG: hypothetical protein D3925_13155, partial [Candidatus Electrothrix sp. AR5]|nr:hypothetical protein [Candidatus Electrothrix sp. AR5]
GVHPAPIATLDPDEFDEKVRIFGFPDIALDGKWVDGILKRPTGKGWIQINHEDSSGSIEPGFSGTAIWSIRKNAVCGMTVSMLNSTASYMIPADTLLRACPKIDQFIISSNPYKGLDAFQEKDTQFYFGRESEAATLREKIEKQSFTAVIGASGSGKSSLVFAGLLPILRQSTQWGVITCRPNNRIFHELARSLTDDNITGTAARYTEKERIKQILIESSDPYRLNDLITEIKRDKGYNHFLLVIDQFEELYTLNDDETARRFMDCLLEAIQPEKFHVLVTMQGNFHDNLNSAISLTTYPSFPIENIDKKGLREVIERPAKMRGVAFEPGLADTIIQELGDELSNLPLLQFCLTQLWERQEYGRISLNAYRNIGGVQQALANHADAVYNSFRKEQDRVRLRHIFLKLIRPGRGLEYTRQATLLKEFGPEHKRLLEKLTDKRLLVTMDDDAGRHWIEIIHEALIQHWQHLRHWVNEEREFLIWREDLKKSIEEWRKRNKNKGILLNEKMFNNALKWQADHNEYLLPHEQEFICASEQAIIKRKYIKRAIPIIIVVPILVIVGLLVDPQQNPFEKKTEEDATETSPSTGQHIDSYKGPLQFVSTKIFFDTEVLQEEYDESASVSHQKLVHNIFFIPENKRHLNFDLEHNMLRGKEFEATIPFLQDCKDTSLYRTFMEGVTFCQQVEESGRKAVYAERTPADIGKYGTLLAPPPPGQSKFDQVLEWAEKQQENEKKAP